MTRQRALALAALLLVVVVVGASLLADVGKLSRVAVSYPWWRLAPACALVLGNYTLRTVRFRTYLRAVDITVSWTEAALVFVAGFLFTVTPGKMGEVVKGWLLHKRRGVAVADVASCVVAERFTDVVGLLAIAALGVAEHGAHAGLFLAVVGLCAAFLVAVLQPSLLPALAARVRSRLTAGGRLAAALDTVVRIHAVLRQLCAPRRLAVGVALAAGAWLLEAVAFRILLDGLGAGAGLGSAVVVYAMATLFGAVSMLPGGVGSTEAVMVALCLTPSLGLHLDLQQATLATLLIRFATLWFGVLLGAVAFGPAGQPQRAA
jgi:uncharacterized protein (TIRG00374 family)